MGSGGRRSHTGPGGKPIELGCRAVRFSHFRQRADVAELGAAHGSTARSDPGGIRMGSSHGSTSGRTTGAIGLEYRPACACDSCIGLVEPPRRTAATRR